MNIKARLKSYSFWVSLASAVFLLIKVLGQSLGFSVDESLYNDIFTALCGVLVISGIIAPPTAKESAILPATSSQKTQILTEQSEILSNFEENVKNNTPKNESDNEISDTKELPELSREESDFNERENNNFAGTKHEDNTKEEITFVEKEQAEGQTTISQETNPFAADNISVENDICDIKTLNQNFVESNIQTETVLENEEKAEQFVQSESKIIMDLPQPNYNVEDKNF